MAGLDPAIHVSQRAPEDVDARVKPGHDGGEYGASLIGVVTFAKYMRPPAGELPEAASYIVVRA
ncbi:hypothetical protein IQ17_00821 [Bradyrhizobium daqingense]|uniref:Uncharacterized protein n=1 Tax=Bradyrhizobium daqingense TaxID=993502 RepID=A0A562LQ30_9BRAD|nr:hypothetical protein IQ17_00821 [Bradyrhizobium daqingense]